VTTDASDHKYLAVAKSNGQYLISWVGADLATSTTTGVQWALVGGDGTLTSKSGTLDSMSDVADPYALYLGTAYDATNDRYDVAWEIWPQSGMQRYEMTSVSSAGVAATVTPLSAPEVNGPVPTTMLWNADTLLWCGVNGGTGCLYVSQTLVLPTSGGASIAPSNASVMGIYPKDAGFIALTNGNLVTFDPQTDPSGTTVMITDDPDFSTNAQYGSTVGAWDGKALALVGPHTGGGLSLTRVAAGNGKPFAPPAQITAASLGALAVLPMTDPNDASTTLLAVLTTDGTSLHVMRVGLDGKVVNKDSALVADVLALSGAQPNSWSAPAFFVDGADLVAFWTDEMSPFQQVFTARITCPAP
jgi:hypothetical protein